MEPFKNQHVKRSQKDYSLSFKLAVVKEAERGRTGNRAAMHKYGIQGHGTITEWRRQYGTYNCFDKIYWLRLINRTTFA